MRSSSVSSARSSIPSARALRLQQQGIFRRRPREQSLVDARHEDVAEGHPARLLDPAHPHLAVARGGGRRRERGQPRADHQQHLRQVHRTDLRHGLEFVEQRDHALRLAQRSFGEIAERGDPFAPGGALRKRGQAFDQGQGKLAERLDRRDAAPQPLARAFLVLRCIAALELAGTGRRGGRSSAPARRSRRRPPADAPRRPACAAPHRAASARARGTRRSARRRGAPARSAAAPGNCGRRHRAAGCRACSGPGFRRAAGPPPPAAGSARESALRSRSGRTVRRRPPPRRCGARSPRTPALRPKWRRWRRCHPPRAPGPLPPRRDALQRFERGAHRRFARRQAQIKMGTRAVQDSGKERAFAARARFQVDGDDGALARRARDRKLREFNSRSVVGQCARAQFLFVGREQDCKVGARLAAGAQFIERHRVEAQLFEGGGQRAREARESGHRIEIRERAPRHRLLGDSRRQRFTDDAAHRRQGAAIQLGGAEFQHQFPEGEALHADQRRAAGFERDFVRRLAHRSEHQHRTQLRPLGDKLRGARTQLGIAIHGGRLPG